MANRGKTGFIYAIRNWVCRDEAYVGQALNVKRRWASHRTYLRHGKHHSLHLQACWNKYGPDAFVVEVLEEVVPIERMVELEQFHIDQIGTLNHCPAAGSCLGLKHTPETRARMSMAKKGRAMNEVQKAQLAALHAARRGGTLSAAHRASLSAAHLGVPMSDKKKAAISNGSKGCLKSAAHRAAIGAAKKGRPLSEDHKAALRAAWTKRRK